MTTISFIFDMDGTLFQTDTILTPSLQDAFDYLRARGEWTSDTPIEQYRQIMGVPLPVVWQTLLPNHSELLREEVNVYFQKCLIANIYSGKGALYPKVTELFEELKQAGCPIYIASNGLIAYLAAIVDYYKLDEWVTGTYSIEQLQSGNKSDLVQLIRTSQQIARGVVVGDRISDIQAAKANGLTAVGCRFDFAQEDELAQADVVIDDLLELVDYLKTWS